MSFRVFFRGVAVCTVIILLIQSGSLMSQTAEPLKKMQKLAADESDGNGISSTAVKQVDELQPGTGVKDLQDLAPVTQSGLMKTEAVTVYDFTTGPDKYYNYSVNPTVGAKDLGDGNWGMRAGDGNQDGYVNATDKGNVWRVQNGTGGYLEGDFNLDGYVNATDIGNYWRVNNGTGTTVPE